MPQNWLATAKLNKQKGYLNVLNILNWWPVTDEEWEQLNFPTPRRQS